ncbi:MAG: hypothetical protein UY72_C0061G0011 [Candidatus Uhrbacteria bacterium GW2011_GWD2_52_7]|uniref:Uncharacterized protein n=1 Tax=Candidatus Uhrbacteria bacterium GW2011_GWD2_52_7 TaxID=1618989 RepID=A0A0G1XCX2_9BACT|nr:MAG: hypothetical protein UY72_C0061G0011 [Candidatus Uhrbacteria bacterium GW2011_GWD2_52_7]
MIKAEFDLCDDELQFVAAVVAIAGEFAAMHAATLCEMRCKCVSETNFAVFSRTLGLEKTKDFGCDDVSSNDGEV